MDTRYHEYRLNYGNGQVSYTHKGTFAEAKRAYEEQKRFDPDSIQWITIEHQESPGDWFTVPKRKYACTQHVRVASTAKFCTRCGSDLPPKPITKQKVLAVLRKVKALTTPSVRFVDYGPDTGAVVISVGSENWSSITPSEIELWHKALVAAGLHAVMRGAGGKSEIVVRS